MIAADVSCSYSALIDLDSTVALTDKNVTMSPDSTGSWDNTFHMTMYNQDYTTPYAPPISLKLGYMAYLSVNWEISSMVGQVKFMLKKCSVMAAGVATPIEIVRRNCFLKTVSAANRNADQETLVDQISQFEYRAFDFAEDETDQMEVTVKCTILYDANIYN